MATKKVKSTTGSKFSRLKNEMTPLLHMAREINGRYAMKSENGIRVAPEIHNIDWAHDSKQRLLDQVIDFELQAKSSKASDGISTKITDVQWDVEYLYSNVHSDLTDQGTGAMDRSYHISVHETLKTLSMSIQIPMGVMVEMGLAQNDWRRYWNLTDMRFDNFFGVSHGKRRPSGAVVFATNSSVTCRDQLFLEEEKQLTSIPGRLSLLDLARMPMSRDPKNAKYVYTVRLELRATPQSDWGHATEMEITVVPSFGPIPIQ